MYAVAILVFVRLWSPAPSIVVFTAWLLLPRERFWNENENVDEGAGVWQRLGRKCVPFANVFGKTKIMSYLKGPWERIASYSLT